MNNQKAIDETMAEANAEPEWIKGPDRETETSEYLFKLQIWASTDGKNTVTVELDSGFSPKQAAQAREIVKETYAWMVTNMGTKPEMWEKVMNNGSNGSPKCPNCGGPMEKRRQRSTGKLFWGCLNYPKCRGTINIKA